MPPRLFSFSMLIGLGAVLGHLYLYRRLVRELVHGRVVRLLAIVFLTAMGLLMGMRRTLLGALPEETDRLVKVAMYSWMGVALCLVMALGLTDLSRGILAVARRLRQRRASEAPALAQPTPPVDAERRKFLGRAVAGGALVAGGGLATYGHWRAFVAPPLVTELAIKIPKLPRALDGFTIVQLTDVHVGPFIRRRFMDELVRHANALEPDLVAITGDLVDGDVPILGDAVAALRNLRSRYGSYFVTGNHEYYAGDVAWVEFLQSLDIQTLRNRHVRIGDAGASLDLVGVDDWSGWRRTAQKGYDLDQALAGRDADRAAVLLAHQPANFKQAAERGVDLQISGHTHGGQLPPMTLFIDYAWEHAVGLYRHQDSHIYVSRGCGFWGPPMRVGSPPELVKLVLTT
ncbi:metallophosphoesterase [Myxococcus stipitatus DSM 14675]|uniref:Metallophosphoesterase n=1 Tax=Myxococcus stipitatus (strain DSM 14675 / JCM 12634 / Mx s8) TaxID=1278073 RepID=L7UF31_MYXSD|nr:metallophosphoesterase [Myxococcus stipitatus]AGC45054.1 metallophosphoesterase [Myxococcus stipitatus DSM 14675]